MKAIFLPLIALLLSTGSFAQITPTPLHLQGMEILQKMPVESALNLRSGESLLDSIICQSKVDQTWEPNENTYFFYDDQDLLVRDSTIIWDQNLGWMPQSQQLYTYTPSLDLETTTAVTWDSLHAKWGKDSIRLVNSYDNEGRLVAVWTWYYEVDFDEWVTDIVDSLSYDAEGQLIQRVVYVVDGLFQNFTPIARALYGYEDGLLVGDIFQFSFDGMAWINFFRQFYYYENGLLSYKRMEFYDENTSNFEEAFKETYAYDSEGRLSQTEGFLWVGGIWDQFDRCDYYYSGDLPSSVGDRPLANQELRMANPFHGGLVEAPGLDSGKTYDITVFSLSGQPVLRQTLGGNAWQLPALPGPGHYVLIVEDRGQILARKKVVAVY